MSVLMFSVTSCTNRNIETEKQRAANGYVSFKRKSGEQPIVGAPNGVTLISLSLLGDKTENRTIQYTLNLPKLPRDKVYSVAYEIIYDDKVIDSGVSRTEIGQNGIVPFIKERDLSKTLLRNYYDADWFRVTVKIVDAG